MARIQDFEQFIKDYNPHIKNDDIKQYDTHSDWDLIKNTSENNVWTVADGDNGDLYITPGRRYVNRLFYIITEKPWVDYNKTRDYKY